MSEDDSPPSAPLEQAAQDAASVASAASEPEAAERAAQQAASAGIGAASTAVASEIPEEAQAAAAAAAAAGQAAVTDPSSAATAAAGAGAQAGVGQAASAAGVPGPVATAGTTMAQGAITQALSEDENAAENAADPETAAASPAGGSDASHYAGFQAPDSAASAAAEAVAAVLGEDQGHVDATFECAELDVFFDVLDVQWTDRLDAPYEVRVRVSTDDIDAELGRMLGADCSVTLRRNDQEQRLVGVCAEAVEGASSEHSAQAMLLLVPAYRLMELRRDSRIFQDKTVPQIIDEVLTESLGAFGRTFRSELDRTYPTCEYRVQYDETDYDFVQRLIEEEGLIYWFDHEGDTEEMVFIDDAERHPIIERPEGETLEILGFESGQGNLEVVREFHMRGRMKPTQLSLRQWEWTRAVMIEGEAEGEAPPPEELPNGALSGAPREQYEHDSRPLTFHEYASPTFGENDLADQLRLRREEQSQGARVGKGKGTVVALRSGHRFVLSGHRAIELDGGYLLTEVVHHFSIDGTERYVNEFKCLPEGVPFRPMRKRQKPRIAGMQTATVVGPPDEEIHTDEHGRIMVQFHWDRQGNYDDHSTCFIRVMQAWAGPGWGFMFLPRIGMEVVVSFLDGDPDRPLVTGSVYNGANPPPYAMPDEKTKSTIKTSSSPGGDGYNELTFEDAAGAEQIIVHAQKDYNETVENDHSTTVHGSQTQSVDGTQGETIGGDQTLTAKKNRMVTVHGSQNVTINGEEGSGGITGASLGITGDYTVDASKTIAIQAPDMISLTCGDSKIEMVPGRITLETAGSKFEITADIIATAANGAYAQLKDFAKIASVQGSELFLNDSGLYKSSQGSEVKLTAAVEATSVPGSKLKLDDKALVSGVAEASLEGPIVKVTGDAEATMSAKMAKVAGQAMASVQGGAGSLTCDPGGATIQGPVVKVN